jgi:hypothetical protein
LYRLGSAFFSATVPYASSGAYVNFMTQDKGDRVAAAYGANYVARIKKQYNPANIFRLNQNQAMSLRRADGWPVTGL